MKTFVVGDIHGGLAGLEQALAKAPIEPTDLVVFLGDYLDGWSDGPQTIDFLLALQERQKCLFLCGNHDELCLNYLKNGVAPELWLAHGGAGTQSAYQRVSQATIQKHIAFLTQLDNYYQDSENRLFVHAGFTHQEGPKNEFYAHTVYWDRTLWELACAIGQGLSKEAWNYPKRLSLFEEIFIGHTPVTRINRSTHTQCANVWNIDTGAAFQGPLSILEVSSKAFWQSAPLHCLYPNESGRNK